MFFETTPNIQEIYVYLITSNVTLGWIYIFLAKKKNISMNIYKYDAQFRFVYDEYFKQYLYNNKIDQ